MHQHGYKVGNEYYLTDSITIAGNEAMPAHDGRTTIVGNTGDGYAKITLLAIQ